MSADLDVVIVGGGSRGVHTEVGPFRVIRHQPRSPGQELSAGQPAQARREGAKVHPAAGQRDAGQGG